MKLNSKLFKTLLISAFALMLTPISAFADADTENETAIVEEENVNYDSEINPQAENTMFHYKEVNGVWCRRLWSITNSCWLGPWMPADEDYVRDRKSVV